MRKLLGGLFAGWLLAAGPQAAAQVIELRMASPAPPPSPINTRGLAEWIKDVQAASGGTLSIRLMAGPQLATFENVYDRTLKGVADLAFGTSGTVGGQFPRTEVSSLPFETEDPVETAVALWRTLERGAIAAEYTEVKPLALFSFPHNLFHTKNVRIKSVSDVKGLKIGTAGRLNGDMLARLGAAPVMLPPSDLYQSLSSGLIEGTVTAWTAVSSFKLYEIAKNHFSAPLTSAPAYIVMNKRAYEKLPPQARAAIDKHSGEPLARRMANVVQALDGFSKANVAKMSGHNFDAITPEERARWEKLLESLSAEWVKRTPDGQKVLATFREEIKRFRSGN